MINRLIARQGAPGLRYYSFRRIKDDFEDPQEPYQSLLCILRDGLQQYGIHRGTDSRNNN